MAVDGPLGSRLFFLTMEAQQEQSEDALVGVRKGRSRSGSSAGVSARPWQIGVRCVDGPASGRVPPENPDCPARAVQSHGRRPRSPETVVRGIARWARLVAASTKHPGTGRRDEGGRIRVTRLAQDEAPHVPSPCCGISPEDMPC